MSCKMLYHSTTHAIEKIRGVATDRKEVKFRVRFPSI